jgi:hypothetical protein
MYHFKFCNRIKLVCFLKFVIHEMNSEMVVLTGREKADADMAVSLMLQPATGVLVDERERES